MTSSFSVRPIRLKLFPGLPLAAVLAAASVGLRAASPAVMDSERKLLSPQSLLLDISLTGEEILTVGERGNVLKSRDQGKSWRQIIVPTRATLTNVFFADERYGWASGHSGIILATTDGGDSWTRLTEPNPEVSYFVTYFENRDRGFFAGSYGEYSKTDDSGKTLENAEINEKEPHFYALARNDRGTLFLAGEMGQLMRSRNGGDSWENLDFPYEGSLFDVLCLDGSTLLAYGLRGHIFRSEDEGGHWTEMVTGETDMLTAGVVLNSGTILLATVADQVLMSNDKGFSFHAVKQSGIDGTTGLIEDPKSGMVFFCGRHGVLPVKSEALQKAFLQAAGIHE